MQEVSIQSVLPAELPALALVGRQTFEQTFASDNNPEDFAAYLEQAFSFEQLSKELSDTDSSFFFAKVQGEIVGYLKLNKGAAQTEQVEGLTVEIERIYVDSRMHGAGVGKALFEFAIQEAKSLHAQAIWLGVWEANPKAIEFYSRQGFTAFGEHHFTIGNDVQRDILMRFEI